MGKSSNQTINQDAYADEALVYIGEVILISMVATAVNWYIISNNGSEAILLLFLINLALAVSIIFMLFRRIDVLILKRIAETQGDGKAGEPNFAKTESQSGMDDGKELSQEPSNLDSVTTQKESSSLLDEVYNLFSLKDLSYIVVMVVGLYPSLLVVDLLDGPLNLTTGDKNFLFLALWVAGPLVWYKVQQTWPTYLPDSFS